MTIEKAKDKISKLLALASDANDHEALAALLAARRLMARYKLSERDVVKQKSVLSEARYDGDTFTGVRNAWYPILAEVIAKYHCCGTCKISKERRQTSKVVFVGLGDDPTIAQVMFGYACDHIMRWGRDEKDVIGYGRRARVELRDRVFNYAIGFSQGLEEQYDNQNSAGEIGMELMIVIPQEVDDWIGSLKPKTLRAGYFRELQDIRACGYEDGYVFNPTRGVCDGSVVQP